MKEIIRNKIGFRGILISDDISMKALKYDLVTNAKKSLSAGCNLVLYCAGNIKDNLKLINGLDQYRLVKMRISQYGQDTHLIIVQTAIRLGSRESFITI